MTEGEIKDKIEKEFNNLCENQKWDNQLKGCTRRSIEEITGCGICEMIFYKNKLISAYKVIEELKSRLKGYNDDSLSYHECPVCHSRCNCTYEECIHCNYTSEM